MSFCGVLKSMALRLLICKFDIVAGQMLSRGKNACFISAGKKIAFVKLFYEPLKEIFNRLFIGSLLYRSLFVFAEYVYKHNMESGVCVIYECLSLLAVSLFLLLSCQSWIMELFSLLQPEQLDGRAKSVYSLCVRTPSVSSHCNDDLLSTCFVTYVATCFSFTCHWGVELVFGTR